MKTTKNSEKEIEKKNGAFADFFLTASEGEQKKVITEAAQKANKEQRDLFLRSTQAKR